MLKIKPSERSTAAQLLETAIFAENPQKMSLHRKNQIPLGKYILLPQVPQKVKYVVVVN